MKQFSESHLNKLLFLYPVNAIITVYVISCSLTMERGGPLGLSSLEWGPSGTGWEGT